MIVSKDTNPAKDLYYIGGLVLKYFTENSVKTIEYHDFITLFKKEHNFSTNIVTLSLDWLYIIGYIDLNAEGDIAVCS